MNFMAIFIPAMEMAVLYFPRIIRIMDFSLNACTHTFI